MLTAPSSVREKILIFGGPKVGKSTSWLSIAAMAAESESDAHFHVIDTDEAVPALLLGEKYKGLSNVTVYPAIEWSEYRDAGRKVFEAAGPGDWVIIDFIDKAWKAVQSWFTQEVHGMEIAEFMLKQRLAGKSGWDLYREIDWNVVNPEYDAFAKPFLLRSKANLLVVCEETVVGTEDESAKKQMFSQVKPTGQKSLPYQVRSILRLERVIRGRLLTTIGDRERPELDREEYDSFAWTYLCQTAGWTL